MSGFLKLLLYFFDKILKLWPYILAAIASIFISYQVGHWRGNSAGKANEKAAQAIIGAKEAIKSQSLREKVENETRNLSDADIDADLRAGGWMRSDADR